MGQKTRRFFNDEKVLIFICDPKLAFYTSVSLLSRQIVQFLLRYVQRQLVAFLQDRILMRTFPIDLYIFSYGFVDHAQRSSLHVFSQETIQPLPRFIFCNLEIYHRYDYTTSCNNYNSL